MARTNRRDVLADGEIQVVHCINRSGRRAYLCGKDPLTGVDYEHRPELIRQRLESLAGTMGIEVLGYSEMSNHFHCVLRSRHDVVATWSDDDVAWNWWLLCPARKDNDGRPAEPTEFDLNSIRNDKSGLKEKRVRLSSISWFMRFLSERVAKEANKQDQRSGRFWEGRFKSQILLDDAAILACLQYVDLNPVRAKIAATPESCDFTSGRDRITNLKTADDVSTPDAQDNRIEHGERAGWLRFRWNQSVRRCVQRRPFVEHRTRVVCRWGFVIICNCWTGQVVRFGATSAAQCHRIWNHFSSVLGFRRNFGLTAC